AQQRALARAVVADQTQPVAGGQIEVDVVERLHHDRMTDVRSQSAADRQTHRYLLQGPRRDVVDRDFDAHVTHLDRSHPILPLKPNTQSAAGSARKTGMQSSIREAPSRRPQASST